MAVGRRKCLSSDANCFTYICRLITKRNHLLYNNYYYRHKVCRVIIVSRLPARGSLTKLMGRTFHLFFLRNCLTFFSKKLSNFFSKTCVIETRPFQYMGRALVQKDVFIREAVLSTLDVLFHLPTIVCWCIRVTSPWNYCSAHLLNNRHIFSRKQQLWLNSPVYKLGKISSHRWWTHMSFSNHVFTSVMLE